MTGRGKRIGRKKAISKAYRIELNDITDINDSGNIDILDTKEILLREKVKLDNGGKSKILSYLKGDGDFRSDECVELLKQADVVITNPPFSLFREYIAQLIKYDKKFLVIGNVNATNYKEMFKLIMSNRLWLRYNCVCWFNTPQFGLKEGARSFWYTNLDIPKRHEEFTLFKRYRSEEYPKYDNYDAIEVSKAINIPYDYDGVMGVPVTFLDKFNPDQFEILGITKNLDLYNLKTRKYTSEECRQAYFNKFGKKGTYDLNASGVINKNGRLEKTYARILIKRKANQ